MTEQSITDIAKVAHEANRAWCEAHGDFSQPSWDDAPDWQRDSAINGVLFHRDNPNASNAASHDNWMREKLATGWTYGPHKDPENRKHPCLVPYEDLPRNQRVKDALFRSIVHAILHTK